ncbi:hypothetical protein JOL62DRAFT_560713 [Phyllosticta paracitricarpa]|uniref:Uncharacterized protein n=1 Tax=Phyllosticta paracitricarpa TaxID=2016321 RepID=A0ABR1MSA8_9PEZI
MRPRNGGGTRELKDGKTNQDLARQGGGESTGSQSGASPRGRKYFVCLIDAVLRPKTPVKRWRKRKFLDSRLPLAVDTRLHDTQHDNNNFARPFLELEYLRKSKPVISALRTSTIKQAGNRGGVGRGSLANVGLDVRILLEWIQNIQGLIGRPARAMIPTDHAMVRAWRLFNARLDVNGSRLGPRASTAVRAAIESNVASGTRYKQRIEIAWRGRRPPLSQKLAVPVTRIRNEPAGRLK